MRSPHWKGGRPQFSRESTIPAYPCARAGPVQQA